MKITKVILTAFSLTISVSLLIGCGSYRKSQTAVEMATPFDCNGFHMNHAQWHYAEADGFLLDVDGSCRKGMKHGQFHFYNKGVLIAKAKFTRDVEVKATCVGVQDTKMALAQCLDQARNRK